MLRRWACLLAPRPDKVNSRIMSVLKRALGEEGSGQVEPPRAIKFKKESKFGLKEFRPDDSMYLKDSGVKYTQPAKKRKDQFVDKILKTIPPPAGRTSPPPRASVAIPRAPVKDVDQWPIEYSPSAMLKKKSLGFIR